MNSLLVDTVFVFGCLIVALGVVCHWIAWHSDAKAPQLESEAPSNA
jgi:hypothetical protein